jgi:hypothetical protein
MGGVLFSVRRSQGATGKAWVGIPVFYYKKVSPKFNELLYMRLPGVP